MTPLGGVSTSDLVSGPPADCRGQDSIMSRMAETWRRDDGYEISTDSERLDLELTHANLAASYWATGIPREVVQRSIAGSIAFGVYSAGDQVGFARVVSDRATFAWIGDVFIVEAHRGHGL